MGKNNRKRRAKKQALKIKREKKAIKKKIGQKDDSIAPEFQVMQNPFSHLSDDERKQAIKEIAENSERVYQESVIKVKEILTTYDPITLLSILASYGLTVPVGDDGLKKKDSEFEIKQAHIELCQAFALQINPGNLKREPFGPDVVQVVWEVLPAIMEAHNFRRIAERNDDAADDEKAVNLVQQSIRGNTQMVRNWGYFSQVTHISKEMYEPFDRQVKDKYGFTASNIIELFKYLINETEERSTKRFQDLKHLYKITDKKELVYKYHELIGQQAEDAESFINGIKIASLDRKTLFSMLMSRYDLRLSENYIFSVEEISNNLDINKVATKGILEEFAYSFGDLEGYDTEHIYLSNPVWLRPLIRIEEDKYFCAIPQLFFSFVIPSLEKLIESIDKKGLSDRRANYLEGKVSEIINRRFPESNTISGVKWMLNGIEYETDLITFIDSHALIVEAKSGKITEPALRGAPDRLKRHIKEILVEPNLQSKRLKERLLELIANPETDDDLRKKLPVDLSDIHKVIRVSVSLEDFAMLQANVSQLKDTGWLPDNFEPCPTMNLADFETLFDFLEHPVQIIHYLERRQELEAAIGFMGDELDLMGLYIDTLFNIGDIDQNIDFVITEMSAPLDAYYNSRDAGIDIPKPTPKICPLFVEIFNQLEQRKTPGWTEIGVILNRLSPDDQRRLTKMIARLKKNVLKNWAIEGHKNIVVFAPPKASEYALCYVIYNDQNVDRRKEFIEEAAFNGLAPEHVKQCLVIAKNMDKRDVSYHSIGLYR